MKDNMLEMRDLITKSQVPLLYLDENRDDFLLCSFGEVFIASNNTLRLYVTSQKAAKIMRLDSRFSDEWDLDEGYYCFHARTSDLQAILSLFNTRKNKMPKNSKKLKSLEERFGHSIIPFRPKIYDEQQGI